MAVVLYSAAKNNRGYVPNDAEYIHCLFYELKERHPGLFEDINFRDYKGSFPWSDEVDRSIQSLSSDGCIEYNERCYHATERLKGVVEKARKKDEKLVDKIEEAVNSYISQSLEKCGIFS